MAAREGAGGVRIGVSSCLLGESVRFDGGHKRQPFLVQTVGPHVTWVPVCPEVEVGMPVPREAIRLRRDGDRVTLVGSRTGADHTPAMERYAARRLEELASEALDGYIVKKGSPTCGLFRVKVYEKDRAMPDGRGMFTDALTRRFPRLPVEEEGRLNDPRLREHFFERVFAHRRWRELCAAEPTTGALVRFHAAHKMTLLAHDRQSYQALGRLVAGAGKRPAAEVYEEYADGFFEAMSQPATPKTHTNVLEHLAGFCKERLDSQGRQHLSGVIHDYRLGMVPLVVPLALLRFHLLRDDAPEWVREQVYLQPFPKELQLRR